MTDANAKPTSLVQITAFLITATIIVLTMINGSSIFIPIVLSIFIWMILNDMTTYINGLKFGRFQIPRPVAMGLIILIIVQLILRFTGTILNSANDFSVQLPTYTENLNALLSTIPESAWIFVLGESADFSTGIVEQLLTLAGDFLATYISTFATGVSSFATNAVYVIVYIIFLILEQNTFARKSYNSFSGNESRAQFIEIIDSIHSQIQTYLTVKTLVSFLTGVASYIVMWLFGLEYAIIWCPQLSRQNFGQC